MSLLPARAEARWMLASTLFFAVGTGLTLPFLYIYLHQVRGLDATIVGAASAWTGLASLLLGGPVGTLVDRFGARVVAIPLFVVGALGTFGWALVHTPWQAFVAATLAAGGGATFSAQNTLVTTLTDEAERHRFFAVNFALLNLGIGIGSAVAGFIADVHRPASFGLLYTIDGVTWLVPAAILLALPSVGGRLAARGEAEAAGGYRQVLADRTFRRLLLFMALLTACGYAQVEVGLPAFATTVGHVSTHVVAWSAVGNTVTIVVAQLLVVRRLEGRSRSRALALAAIIVAASWVVLGVGCFGRGWSTVLPVVGVIAANVVFATAETIFTPLTPQLTNDLAPDELRGRYNAFGGMTWGITAVVGPLTAAPLIGHGLGGVWLGLVIVGALGAAGMARALHRRVTPAQDGRAAAPVPVG